VKRRLPIRGILFDKDGTLVDFEATWAAIAHGMALRAAGGDDGLAQRLLARAGYDAETARFLPDSPFASGTNADIVALWYPDAAPKLRAEALHAFDTYCALEGAARAVPLDGVLDALRALHASGYRLGVATNDSTTGAEATVRALGVAQLFEAVYGYDAVANPKPAGDVVQAFADMSGLKPGEIAMVGDNLHDLETGRAGGAGLVVAVLSGTGIEERLAPLADFVIGSAADLPALLKDWAGRS
jgi:phosphoglycolate phosphatase